MARSVEARRLEPAERDAAVEYLTREAKANLLLLDLVVRFGWPPAPGEARTEIVAAWRGGEIAGLASLRPSVVLDAGVKPEAIEAFLPYLDSLGLGLVKSSAAAVDLLWSRLSRRRQRRAVVDRIEIAYAVRAEEAVLRRPRAAEVARPAVDADLEALVVAARESLREEHRPDPFAGDAKGFRRWVQGRVQRARVVESGERIHFAGYADVRRPEGWLLQGIYTWPAVRRRGYATTGVSYLCREAFAVGADHVQLAVVEDNLAGRALYRRLGFSPFARLRTILFA
jgi:RimJ/RimL family protein N-acetyltransferase